MTFTAPAKIVSSKFRKLKILRNFAPRKFAAKRYNYTLYVHRTPPLKPLCDTQPSDPIDMLLQLHENSIVPVHRLTVSCPPSPPPPTSSSSLPAGFENSSNLAERYECGQICSDGCSPGNSQSVYCQEYLESRADFSRLCRDHYCSLENATTCANENCCKHFVWSDRKRNCCMCGKAFCRKCTKLLRKLSQNAEPDLLGTLRNVCKKCFNFNSNPERYRDLTHEFLELRDIAKRSRQSASSTHAATPLPARPRLASNVEQVRAEIDRLVKGFEDQGHIKALVSELVGTPKWQKSSHWVSDSKPSECFKCQKKFRLTIRKINCRVCGQVFCTGCTKSQILLYCYKDSPARWAINGKEGGPTSKLHRFETLPICSHCCGELEALLLSSMEEPTPEEHSCLDETICSHCCGELEAIFITDRDAPTPEELRCLEVNQTELISLQTNVEQFFPRYQKLVDTLDIEDSSLHSVQGEHALQELARARTELSDSFTDMAFHGRVLKKLQPKNKNLRKILKNIKRATDNFYREHLYLFKVTNQELEKMLIPIDNLSLFQRFLDQLSMHKVYILLQQLSRELDGLQIKHKCELDAVKHLVQLDRAIEEEYRPFLTSQGGSWDEYVENIQCSVIEAIDEQPCIQLQQNLPCDHTQLKVCVRYFTLRRTRFLLVKCQRQLVAKTNRQAFLKTKSSLANAMEHITDELRSQ